MSETDTEVPAPPLAEEPVPGPGAYDDPFAEGAHLDGPEDEEDEGGEEEEGEGEEEEAVAVGATVPAPAPEPPRRRVGGRKRGTGNRPKFLESPELKARHAAEEAAARAAAAPATGETPIAKTQYNTQGFDPRDVMIVWPQILESLKRNGRGPQDLFFRVERTGVGMYASPATIIDASLPADDFGGSESQSGGQQLVEYITQVYHLGRRQQGAAVYKIYPHHKVGTGGYRPMTLRLDHPDEILGAQRRKAEYESQQRMNRAAAPIMPQRPVGAGAAPLPPPMPPIPAAMGPQGGAGFDFFDYARRYEEWRANVAASGQPMPPPAPPVMMTPQAAPPPPPPPAPAMSAEDRELLEEARFARRLRALGPDQLRMLGFVPAAAQTAAQAPAAAVTAAANNPVEALRGLLKIFKDVDGLRSEFGEALGAAPAAPGAAAEGEEPEDDEGKPTFYKVPIPGHTIMWPKTSEGTVDFIQQAILANPEMTNELAMKFMGAAMKQLDGSNFLKLIEKLAAGGGLGPQVAAQARDAGMMGMGAPTNGMVRPKGPMA